jgi:nucleoside-diphosphate-sugar epimerase
MPCPGPIAILGATSQIARDFVAGAKGYDFHLFGRSGGTQPYSSFGMREYSAIINFVGVGDPARAKDMGAGIFTITRDFDQLALDYLKSHPKSRYIFLSSGAAYGHVFARPVTQDSLARLPLNAVQAQDWYGAAKLYAEMLHRSHGGNIIDIRIFNYISRTMDVTSRFLIADMINAVRDNTVFRTNDRPLMRDFLHPADFRQMIDTCLAAPDGANLALDCYSRGAISKEDLVKLMAESFGMKFQIVEARDIVNATGEKPNYYSENHRAAALGYEPDYSSASAIREEVAAILSR